VAGDADIAAVGALLGDRARARMLAELLHGESASSSRLAQAGGVSRATASFHLSRLLEGNLVAVEARGRGRHYRLAGPEVARAIEALQVIAPRAQVNSLRGARNAAALAQARFCYDHLAGRLAIELVDAMSARGLIALSDDRFEPSEEGVAWFAGLGIDVVALSASRRSFARACVDWSEQRPHLAGALGAALAERLLELCWIERAPDSRVVRVTRAGLAGFTALAPLSGGSAGNHAGTGGL
jgi:DNA-binding transcriptional ArsR family regulator